MKISQNFPSKKSIPIAKRNFPSAYCCFSEKETLISILKNVFIGYCTERSSWRMFPRFLGKALGPKIKRQRHRFLLIWILLGNESFPYVVYFTSCKKVARSSVSKKYIFIGELMQMISTSGFMPRKTCNSQLKYSFNSFVVHNSILKILFLVELI